MSASFNDCAACLGGAGSPHTHTHCPSRFYVELVVFRYLCKRFALQNPDAKSAKEVVEAVLDEWPFELYFTPQRLAQWMSKTITNRQKAVKADPTLVASFEAQFPHAQVELLLAALKKTDGRVWGVPILREFVLFFIPVPFVQLINRACHVRLLFGMFITGAIDHQSHLQANWPKDNPCCLYDLRLNPPGAETSLALPDKGKKKKQQQKKRKRKASGQGKC